MKKIRPYLLSLLSHLLVFVLIYLLFALDFGVVPLCFGKVSMIFLPVFVQVSILVLLYVAVRWSARLRRPLVSVVLLVLSLLTLASSFLVQLYEEDQIFNYTPAATDVVTPEAAAFFPITSQLGVSVESMQVRKRGGDDQPSLMLQIHRGERVQPAFLTQSSTHDLRCHRLDMKGYKQDAQGRITQISLRAKSLYSDYLARAGAFGSLASLLLLLVTYLLRMRVWVLLGGLSLTLGCAMLIVSYSEHEVLEVVEFQDTPTGVWLPNHRQCAGSLVAVNETDAAHPLPQFAAFEVNVNDKLHRRTCILRVGGGVRAHNSFLQHTGVMGSSGECLITCRYAHWPYLSAALFMLNLGLGLLACALYRAEMVRRHMAEKEAAVGGGC